MYQNSCAHYEALLQLSFCVMRYFRTSWLKTNTVLLYLVTLWVGNLNKSPLSNLSVPCGMDWVPWWYSAEGCSGGPRTTSLTWGIECEWCLLPLWGLLDDVACVVSGPHLRAVRLLSWWLRISRGPGGSCKTYYPASEFMTQHRILLVKQFTKTISDSRGGELDPTLQQEK